MGNCCTSSDAASSSKHKSRNLRPKNVSIFDTESVTSSISSSAHQQRVAPRTWRWERHGEPVALHSTHSPERPIIEGDETDEQPNRQNSISNRPRIVSISSPTHQNHQQHEQQQNSSSFPLNNNNNNDEPHPTFVDPESNSVRFPTGAVSSIVHQPGALQDGEYFSIMISPALASAIANACKILDDAEKIATSGNRNTASGAMDDQENPGLLEYNLEQQLKNSTITTTISPHENNLPLPWPWTDTKNCDEEEQNQDDEDGDDEQEVNNNNNNNTNNDIVKNNVLSCYNMFIGGSTYKKSKTSSIGWSAYDMCLTCDVDYAMKERAAYSRYNNPSTTTANAAEDYHNFNYSNHNTNHSSSLKKTGWGSSGPATLMRKTSLESNNNSSKATAKENNNNNNNNKYNPIPARCIAGVGIAMKTTAKQAASNDQQSSSYDITGGAGSTTSSSNTAVNTIHATTTAAVGSLQSLPAVKTTSSSKLSSLEQEIKVKIVESFSLDSMSSSNLNSTTTKRNWTKIPSCQVIARVVLLVHQGRLCFTTDDVERYEEEMKKNGAASNPTKKDFFKDLTSPGVRTPGGSKLADFDTEHEVLSSENGDDENENEDTATTATDAVTEDNNITSSETTSPTTTTTTNKKQQQKNYQRRKSFGNSSIEGKRVGLESAHISNHAAAQWYLHVSGLQHPYTEIHDADSMVLFESVAHPGFFLTADVPNVDLRRYALPSMSNPLQWNLSLTIRERNLPREFVEKVLLVNTKNNMKSDENTNNNKDTTMTMRNRIESLEHSEIENFVEMNMSSALHQFQEGAARGNVNNMSDNNNQHQHHMKPTVTSILAASALASSTSSSQNNTIPIPLPPCPLAARDMTQSFRLVRTVIKNSSENLSLPVGRESSTGHAPWQLPWFGPHPVKLGVFDFFTSISNEEAHNDQALLNNHAVFLDVAGPSTTTTPSSASPLTSKSLLRPHSGIIEPSIASSASKTLTQPSSSFYFIPDALFHVKIISSQDPQLMLAATGSQLMINKKQKQKQQLQSPRKKQLKLKSSSTSPMRNPLASSPISHSLNNQHDGSGSAGATFPSSHKTFSSTKLEVAWCKKSALKKIFNLASLGYELDGEALTSGNDDDDDEETNNKDPSTNDSHPTSLLAEDASLWRISFVESACPIRSELNAGSKQIEKANSTPSQQHHQRPGSSGGGNTKHHHDDGDRKHSITSSSASASNTDNHLTIHGYRLLQRAKHIQLMNKLFPGFCLTFSRNLDQWCLAEVEGGDQLPKNMNASFDDESIFDNNNDQVSGENAVDNNPDAVDDQDDDDENAEYNDRLLQNFIVEPARNFELPPTDEDEITNNSSINNNNNKQQQIATRKALTVANHLMSIPTTILTKTKSLERDFLSRKWLNALFNYSSTNHTHHHLLLTNEQEQQEQEQTPGLMINLPFKSKQKRKKTTSTGTNNNSNLLPSIPLPSDTLSLGVVPVQNKIGTSSCVVRVVVFHKMKNDEQDNQRQRQEPSSRGDENTNQQHHQHQSNLVAKNEGVNAGERCTSPSTDQQQNPPSPQREETYKVNVEPSRTDTNQQQQQQRPQSNSTLSTTNQQNLHNQRTSSLSRPQSSLSIRSEMSHAAAPAVAGGGGGLLMGSSGGLSSSYQQQQRVTGLVNSQAGWILQWTSNTTAGARNSSSSYHHQHTTSNFTPQTVNIPTPPPFLPPSTNNTNANHQELDDTTNNNNHNNNSIRPLQLPALAPFEHFRVIDEIIVDQLNNSFLLVPVFPNVYLNKNEEEQQSSPSPKLFFMLMHLASCTSSPVRRPMFLTFVRRNGSSSSGGGGVTLSPFAASGTRDGLEQVFSIDLV